MKLVTLYLWIALEIFLFVEIDSRTKSRFNNLKCENLDPSFATFKKCKLKLLSRGVVSLDIWIALLKLPISNVQINWSVYRRYNGFKPFLYNVSCDFCALLRHYRKMSFESMVLAAVQSGSNLKNDTCPINHDIIVENLVFNDGFLQKLPVPNGEYMIELRFATNKVWRYTIQVYILQDE